MTETNKKEPLAKVKFRLAPPGFTWRPTYFLPFGFTVLAAIGMVFLPVLVGRIIELHSQGDASSAWGLMTWMLLIVAGLSFHEKFTWGITFKLIARLEKEWRLYISSMVARSSDRDAGSLIAILNKDSRAMAMLWQPLVPASSGVALTILGTWQLWVISPTVAVVVLAGLIVTVWALTVISKFLEKHADAFRDTVGKSTSRASDIAASIRTILGLGAQGQMMKRYGKNAQEVYLAQLKMEGVQTWSFAARNILTGSVTLLAIAFALRGTLQEGTWITDIPAGQLVTIIGLIAVLGEPIWSVEMLLFGWRNARVALRRVERLEAEEHNTSVMADGQDAAAQPSLLGRVQTGQLIYRNPRTLGLTAQEYAERLAAELRQKGGGRVLLSEPNPMIFAGSLADHLQAGTHGLSQAQMLELLQITDSLEIAHRLGGTEPEKFLAAQLSSEGANLSGGQRQRLALARALAQDSTYLVLTEPLNSVDEPSQRYILDRLEEEIGKPGGLLGQLQVIYLVSTTVEVEARLARQQKEDARG